MRLPFDYVVVGAGLTGATIARTLCDHRCRVLIIERRAHVGGNVYDEVHPSGIRVPLYGPHYFRTNSESIWSFVNRFTTFYPYEARIKSLVDGRYENWPIPISYINRVLNGAWHPAFTGTPSNFEEASLSMMPVSVYEKFVKSYSEKQWGVPPRQLSAALAKRFEVRTDGDDRLSRHKYQGLPTNGYTAMVTNMLAGIPVILNCDYHREPHLFDDCRQVVYTGPIDELFGFRFGELQYRGQSREHVYVGDVEYLQPYAQINFPDLDAGRHVRTLEWKRMMLPEFSRQIRGSVLTHEIPMTADAPDRYEYPFPDERNQALYAKYRTLADAMPNVLVCGRLGDYKYYDMDQAIARARMKAQRLLVAHGVIAASADAPAHASHLTS